jgi:hypothetical protein
LISFKTLVFSKISIFLTKSLPLVYPRFTPKTKNAMLTIRAEVQKDKKRMDNQLKYSKILSIYVICHTIFNFPLYFFLN